MQIDLSNGGKIQTGDELGSRGESLWLIREQMYVARFLAWDCSLKCFSTDRIKSFTVSHV